MNTYENDPGFKSFCGSYIQQGNSEMEFSLDLREF